MVWRDCRRSERFAALACRRAAKQGCRGAMIAVESLTVRAGSVALEGVSFALRAGQYGVLMGKTGSGKTPLLEAICGLKPVAAGRVLLTGRDVTRLKPAERGVGYVPQDRALFPTMTVWD